MTVNYSLDEQDLKTHQFVDQISHGADKIDAKLLKTQSTYSIDQARVVALGNPRYAGTPVNPLAVRLDLSLVGFKDQNGDMSKLVDENAKSLEDQYQKGRVNPRTGNVSMLYKVNDNELKSLIDGGLYADPRQFNRNLNLVSSGKQFSIPDQVRVSTMEFQDTKKSGVHVGGMTENPTYTVSSAQPVSQLTTFDNKTPNNSYTFLFNTLAAALTQRRYHPEEQANMIIQSAEDRYAKHQAAVNNEIQVDPTFGTPEETPAIQALSSQPKADTSKVQRIRSTENEDQQFDEPMPDETPAVKPLSSSSSSTRLDNDQESHLQHVLNEITNKAARENRQNQELHSIQSPDAQNQDTKQKSQQSSRDADLDGMSK